MIVVNGLTKTFPLSRRRKREMGSTFVASTVDALRDVSFTCRPGSVFALLGPNGAGKTTALRIIATLLRPTAGTASVAGFDTVTQPQEVRRRIGFLTGHTGLYHRLTPNELVKYFADLHGLDSRTLSSRREELFTRLDMHEFAGRRIGQLSSGMRQKVSIVRTMIHDPQVIIFDEPTASLDVVTSRNILQLIRDCRTAGKTVLFSTHRMGEVSLMSDDLAVIHKGQLRFNGSWASFQEQMQTRSVEDEFIRLVEES